jgi:RNA polymerase sigma factor (sigma-70 family)
MLSTVVEREAQASEFLRLATLPLVRTQLLAYATKLTECPEAGMDLYQQALLDTHEAVQLRGILIRDVRFYLFGVMRNSHIDEQRRRAGLAPLPEHAHELPDEPLQTDPTAHLASQVEAYVQESFEPADRVLLRLNADNYSTRQIQQMTGQPARTVLWRLTRMKEQIRAVFAQSW